MVAAVWPSSDLAMTDCIVMFMNNCVYSVERYVYLVRMKHFYEWSLGIAFRGAFDVYHFSLTYYEGKGIDLCTDLQAAKNIAEYLNIELCDK